MGRGPRAVVGRAAGADFRRARRRDRHGRTGGTTRRARAETLDARRRRPDRDAPRQADPDIRQEIARLVDAITGGNRQRLRAAGGFDTAADRLEWLQRLPEGAPTKAPRRAAIDRYSIWSTIRLVSPEAALF